MTNQALAVVEPVLSNAHGGIIKGKLNVQMGRFELTAARIIFYAKPRFWMAFGALGMLIAGLLKGKRAFDIELSTITAIARTKYGLNKNILDVTRQDGTTLRLNLGNFDDFTARLREQLSRHGRLVEDGEARWKLVAA